MWHVLSKLMCSVQLITYKVITCGQHGMISGQQAGSLDSASGSRGLCPHLAGQPPKLTAAPGNSSGAHSDFEEILVSLRSFGTLPCRCLMGICLPILPTTL